VGFFGYNLKNFYTEEKMSLISDVIQSTKAVIKGWRYDISQLPKQSWTVQYPDDRLRSAALSRTASASR
jgi:hypothetical protein